MLKKTIAISKMITMAFIPFTMLGKFNLNKNTKKILNKSLRKILSSLQ